jgi:hypothetical protein
MGIKSKKVGVRWVPLANLIQFQPGETIFFAQK